MASQENNPVSYPMSGGDGLQSYYRSSAFQRMVLEKAMATVSNAIRDTLELTNSSFLGISKTFSVADFGCAVGPNTFIAMQSILEAVGLKYQSQHQNGPPLEFQVFFNDHVNNDFNTLFRNIPSSPQFFSAGVPGDFRNRLLPKASIHLGYSSYALQWLSRVPEEVVDANSPACNKDSIYCNGLSKEVAKAYSAQFQRDLDLFLDARAQELVGGGLLIFTLPGLQEGVVLSQNYHGWMYDALRSCLMDMAKQGLTTEAKVESFNIPMYYPPIKELQAYLETNPYFNIEKIDSVVSDPIEQIKGGSTRLDIPGMASYVASSVAAAIRAVLEATIKESFGDEIVDPLFERYLKKLSEIYHTMAEKEKPVNLTVVLKRKI